MAPIKPFKIQVSDADLSLLKQKLDLATLPDELDEAAWDMGAPLSDIRRLSSYWKDGFDWRHQEQKLNQIPQFTTVVEVPGFGELDIHFVHQRSDVENAVPLLFLHGCEQTFSRRPFNMYHAWLLADEVVRGIKGQGASWSV